MKENWEIHWKDYFNILQIHPLAEPEVVKAAYDRLARKYHPDKNPNVTSERMKDLNEAFEILGNPEKRERYYLAYYQKVNPKPIITPTPRKTMPKTNPVTTNTTKSVHDNRRPYDGWRLGNLHAQREMKDDAAMIFTRIIFMAIGIFAIAAPWYKYTTSFSIIWLIISILLSLIFLPITIIIGLSFMRK
jgi:curved DNA-binding protein CbpA